MPAYLVGRVTISDPEVYKAYAAETPAIVAQFGGRFLARGGPLTHLEGKPFEGRLVIAEFPDVQAAQAFYTSPEYQRVRQIRADISWADLDVVPGWQP